MDETPKPLRWIASSRRDLGECPAEVRRAFGYALYQAQLGMKHERAKIMKGFGGAGVLEIVENHDGDTYRAVYTVKFADAVYVLDVFKKKSKRGIETPKLDVDRIKKRFDDAEADWKERSK